MAGGRAFGSIQPQNVIEYNVRNTCSCQVEEAEAAMVQARIQHGRVELREPIPDEWEGQLVKITPMTPDDQLPDLEERLAALHALGPMEFEPGEADSITNALAELNDAGKAAMQTIAGSKP